MGFSPILWPPHRLSGNGISILGNLDATRHCTSTIDDRVHRPQELCRTVDRVSSLLCLSNSVKGLIKLICGRPRAVIRLQPLTAQLS